jgi:CRP-like cAMP-binding protein
MQMKNELIEFISKFSVLTPEDVDLISENIIAKSYPKGTVLLKEGDVNSLCYFIIRGCVRQYVMVDGDEKTTALYTEEQAAFAIGSYATQSVSDHYLVCVEDCFLIVGDPAHEKEMYEKFPKLATITRSMIEIDFGKMQEKLTSFILSSPEQRYLNLLNERPSLFQRVPQHQIASYLGMTAESLSRIRKRVILK